MASENPAKTTDRIALAVSCFILGIFVDFLFNAIFKIIWVAIYGLCYVAIGTTINAYLARTRVAKHTTLSMLTFLIGAAAGHLTMTGHPSIRHYSAKMVPSPYENARIALKTPELAETLYVTSDHLEQKLPPTPISQEPIPLTARVTIQYGCVQNIFIDEIDGVEINSDPAASWTWKIDRSTFSTEPLNMGWGDEKYFWCRKSD
jgi:hypothetical protein